MAKYTYEAVRKAVAAEIDSGVNRLKDSYRIELLRTYWNIGRVLIETVGFSSAPCARNSQIALRLARDFKRPAAIFYDSVKFFRLYPMMPETSLSWSHYLQLIRIKDPADRKRLEEEAIREGISAPDFRTLICLRPGASSQLVPVGKKGPAALSVVRGKLYHYRVRMGEKFQLPEGRVIVDMGFSIDREVQADPAVGFRSCRIVRAVKEGEDYSIRISPYEETRLYTYKALPERIIDGDTIVARIDLGFRNWVTETLRLRGIDTPELSTALGRRARVFVQKALQEESCLIVRTYKQEKYGRFLADVFYKDSCKNVPRSRGEQLRARTAGSDKKGEADPEKVLEEGIFLNQQLLDERLAVPYDGGAKEAVEE